MIGQIVDIRWIEECSPRDLNSLVAKKIYPSNSSIKHSSKRGGPPQRKDNDFIAQIQADAHKRSKSCK